jgi:hypothetical protein
MPNPVTPQIRRDPNSPGLRLIPRLLHDPGKNPEIFALKFWAALSPQVSGQGPTRHSPSALREIPCSGRRTARPHLDRRRGGPAPRATFLFSFGAECSTALLINGRPPRDEQRVIASLQPSTSRRTWDRSTMRIARRSDVPRARFAIAVAACELRRLTAAAEARVRLPVRAWQRDREGLEPEPARAPLCLRRTAGAEHRSAPQRPTSVDRLDEQLVARGAPRTVGGTAL